MWTTVDGVGRVGYKQDVHFCSIGGTILSIKELHLEEIRKMSKTQNVQFANFVYLRFCIHLYAIRSGRWWTGVFKTDEVGQQEGRGRGGV